MENGFLKTKLKDYPIGFIGTCLGAATLANVFSSHGYPMILDIFIYVGSVALLIYILKLIMYPKVVWGEMNNTIFMALYPTTTMLLMNIGVYFAKFNYSIGHGIWLFALLLNVFYVVFFLIRHVIIKFDITTVLPCWYVLLAGISVSCVTSEPMHAKALVKPIFYFIVMAVLTSLPVVIYRLKTVEVPDHQYPLIGIFAAPGSLCTISYVTLYPHPNVYLVSFFFALSVAAVIFDYLNLPRVMSLKFSPAFAGYTFPLAIALVASVKVYGYLTKFGFHNYAEIVKWICGIEFFMTTAIIGFILFNFIFNYFFNIPKFKFTK
ncbi:TDT family transporter [uncultured Clostridium sp.]|uniref:TDT family transporter n=1 Tax=uncultured Clostridium sp. TaxID=59620 RepID=UPI002630C9D8|nr:TDT family transporter [uncultured Clostridium sp.]